MSNTPKPPIGLMPEWRHKELRLQEIREAVKRYIDTKQPVPINWIVEEYCLREWLENREEEKKFDGSRVYPLTMDEVGQFDFRNLGIQTLGPTPSNTSTNEGRDWQVECFTSNDGCNYWRQKSGSYHHKPFDGDIPESHFLEKLNAYKIFQVRRLSDGEVFTVGEKITGLGYYSDETHEIKSMQLINGTIGLNYGGSGSVIIQVAKKPSPSSSNEAKEKERIEVKLFTYPIQHRNGDAVYEFETTKNIPEEKFQIIKASIEAILNNK